MNTCPHCHQPVKLDRDGFVAAHKRGPKGHRRPCDGTGGRPFWQPAIAWGRG